MSRRGSSRQRATPAPSPSQRGGRGGRGREGRGAPPSQQQQQRPSPSASLSRDFERRVSFEERSTPAPSTAPTPAPAPAPAQQQAPPSSTEAIEFPARPGLGTQGTKCTVLANHLLVEIDEGKELWHYDVSVSPVVKSRGAHCAIIQQLVATYKDSHLGGKEPVYDGRKNLYTAGRLPFESEDFAVKLVDKHKTGSTSSTIRREREFNVVIKFAAQDIPLDAPQKTIQVLDVVLRQSPSFKYTPVQRSFFSPELGQQSPLGDGLECWRGFYQSIRPTKMGLSLNIDVSSTAFYKPISVEKFVYQYLHVPETTRKLSDTERLEIEKALRGVNVSVSHMESSRRYRISGITAQPMCELKFPIDDQGSTISVIQYFKAKYNVKLHKTLFPCLQVGSDARPAYLPMEVCEIVKGQRYSRKLNGEQVNAILSAACRPPHQRKTDIEGVQALNFVIGKINFILRWGHSNQPMVAENNYNGDQYAREFEIKVQDRLASVAARVLRPPMLKYHEENCNAKVGQWNMIDKKVYSGGSVDYWTCINFSRMHSNAVHRFCHQLACRCRKIGMTFSASPLVPFQMIVNKSIEVALRDVYKEVTDEKKHLQLLIIILPEKKGSYGKIKCVCETELGIVSQCCQPTWAIRVDQSPESNQQYLKNVALKINVKVGGCNTVLADAVARCIPHVTDCNTPTIIFGADVTHPQPWEDSSPSIAAVVASMDWPAVTTYRGLVLAQRPRQEQIDLTVVVQEQLRAFFRAMKKQKPKRIIFYRDGVGEGQFRQVLVSELHAIKEACRLVQHDGNYAPPVTFVVVQKRHHTRLFPTERRFTDDSGNILPGTVVDTTICHQIEFDFYLCSHAGIKGRGTSRPTHYHVLYDENKFKADDLQKLTNDLCYTYARCTRPVSIVPPVYYAHLAAFRARYYLESDVSDGGSTSAAGGNTRVRPLPQIKDSVKEVMYYC